MRQMEKFYLPRRKCVVSGCLKEYINFAEEGVINSGTTGDQYPVDSGGSDKQSKPLEALHEHEEETINGDKKGSPELSLPETKLQLGQHKDPLEDIYNKLSRPGIAILLFKMVNVLIKEELTIL